MQFMWLEQGRAVEWRVGFESNPTLLGGQPIAGPCNAWNVCAQLGLICIYSAAVVVCVSQGLDATLLDVNMLCDSNHKCRLNSRTLGDGLDCEAGRSEGPNPILASFQKDNVETRRTH